MTDDIKIIRNAGSPPPRGGGTPYEYPFPDMQVGDAFDVPRDGRRYGMSDAVQATVSACARGYVKRQNPSARFSTRIHDENTVRCWRVA